MSALSKNSKSTISSIIGYLLKTLESFTKATHILISPVNLILITVITILFFQLQKSSGNLRLVIEITISILSGVLGGLITDKIKEINEEKYIIKKSVASIRNLQQIKSKITNVMDRIKILTKKQNKRDFSEVGNLIDNIQGDILNSISDWGDVNPNSDLLVDHYQKISDMENKVKRLESDLEDKQKQSKATQEEKTKLEEELKKTKDELNSRKSSLSSGISLASSASLSPSSNNKIIYTTTNTMNSGLFSNRKKTPEEGNFWTVGKYNDKQN